MAGLKNIYQRYDATPFQAVKGDNILERHMSRQMMTYTPYCHFCGAEIIDSRQDEHGNACDPQWEQTYKMHYRCYLKNIHR